MNNEYLLKEKDTKKGIDSFINELIESKNIRKFHMKDKSIVILDSSTWEFSRKNNDMNNCD